MFTGYFKVQSKYIGVGKTNLTFMYTGHFKVQNTRNFNMTPPRPPPTALPLKKCGLTARSTIPHPTKYSLWDLDASIYLVTFYVKSYLAFGSKAPIKKESRILLK